VIKEEQVGPPVGTESLVPEFAMWCEDLAEFFPRIRTYTQSLDVASVAADSTAEQTFTVTGVSSDDMVLSINKPSHSSGLIIGGYRVSAKNTIAITFENSTGLPINPAAEDYVIATLRK